MKSPVLRLLLLFFSLTAGSVGAVDLSSYSIADLSHAYNKNTLYWPTATTHFELQTLSFGDTDGGYFYSAYAVCTPEHGGTHLDAPIHFHKGGLTNDALPLTQLIAPAVVIDVTDKTRNNPDYRLTAEDIAEFEKRHGRIEKGSMALLRTGWSRYWPDAKRYLGDDTPGDAGNLHFPSFGNDAARLLVEDRGVGVLGVDTASIDFGASADFMVHRIAARRNVAGLENLRLEGLPATGITVIALPMKIEGGSGGPVRAVALIPK